MRPKEGIETDSDRYEEGTPRKNAKQKLETFVELRSNDLKKFAITQFFSKMPQRSITISDAIGFVSITSTKHPIFCV